VGRGRVYDCACGYHALLIIGPTFRRKGNFVGAHCAHCHELVSAEIGLPTLTCPQCARAVTPLSDYERVTCPRCSRTDAWQATSFLMID